MAQVRFTTSTDFSQFSAGVFITEVAPPTVVTGAQIVTPLIIGECVKGPVDKAVRVTTLQRFLNIFGQREIVSGGTFAGDVYKALLNKTTGPFFVVRAAAAAAVAATVNLDDTATPVVQVDANSVGTWGNGVSVTVADATDGDANHFDLVATWRANETQKGGQTQRFTNLDVSATGNDNLLARVEEDDSNLIVLTKLADGRPDNGTFALTTGADGSIADTDFTAAGRAIDVAVNAVGVGHAHVAGRSNSVIKAVMATKAGLDNSKLFLVGPDDETISLATAITEVGALARSDRLIYCFGHIKTLDPDTATKVINEPMDIMSNDLGLLPVELGPGIVEVGRFNVGIAEFAGTAQTSLQDADYDAAFVAGISALENDVDAGFIWRDQVTTFLQDGTDRFVLPRRRQVDFILQNLGRLAKNDVNQSNTPFRRRLRAAAASSFLRSLMNSETIVDFAEDAQSDGFIYDTESGNDPSQKALGIQKDLVRVRRIPESRIINLVSQIGTTVQIQVGADGSVTEV